MQKEEEDGGKKKQEIRQRPELGSNWLSSQVNFWGRVLVRVIWKTNDFTLGKFFCEPLFFKIKKDHWVK